MINLRKAMYYQQILDGACMVYKLQFQDWSVSRNKNTPDDYSFMKSFPDGTYVEITVSKVGDSYQVKTTAESRTSGPTEAIQAGLASLDDALNLAYQECHDWDSNL